VPEDEIYRQFHLHFEGTSPSGIRAIKYVTLCDERWQRVRLTDRLNVRSQHRQVLPKGQVLNQLSVISSSTCGVIIRSMRTSLVLL
jgi:hypothetical protein